MKTTIPLILIYLFISSICYTSNGQPTKVLDHYKQLNKAYYILLIDKDSAKALVEFTVAFQYTNILEDRDIYAAIEISNTKGYDSITYVLMIRLMDNGLSQNALKIMQKEATYSRFFNSKYGTKATLMHDSLFMRYLTRIDYEFKQSLDEMVTKDELVRTLRFYCKPNENIPDHILQQFNNTYISCVDCQNKEMLLELMEQKRFKQNENVNRGMGEITFLLLHALRTFETYPENPSCSDTAFFRKANTILLQWVKEGKFSNREYAYLIDRANCWGNPNKGLQVYGMLTQQSSNGVMVLEYPLKDVELVDERRAEIGLPTLKEAAQLEHIQLPENYK